MTVVDLNPDTVSHLQAVVDADVATHWIQRIRARMVEKRQKELREGLPVELPNSEQKAMAILRRVSDQLVLAADALDEAARHLLDDHKGFRAKNAKLAAIRAREVAEGLVGKGA